MSPRIRQACFAASRRAGSISHRLDSSERRYRTSVVVHKKRGTAPPRSHGRSARTIVSRIFLDPASVDSLVSKRADPRIGGGIVPESVGFENGGSSCENRLEISSYGTVVCGDSPVGGATRTSTPTSLGPPPDTALKSPRSSIPSAPTLQITTRLLSAR